MTKSKLIFALSILLLITSCSEKYDEEVFTTELKASFSSKDTTSELSPTKTSAIMYAVYHRNNFQPIWITEKNAVNKAEKLVECLYSLQSEGIPASRYHIDDLQTSIQQMKDNKGTIETQKAITYDKTLTQAYITAAKDLMYGINNPDNVDELWNHSNDTGVSVDVYYDGLNNDACLDEFRSKLPTYEALIKYNKELDNLQDINHDSIRNVIYVNLERLRWLPQSFEENYVLVIVPQMELFLKEGGKTKMNMKVVVGKPSRETPSLNANMENIVFNPSWGVPPGIMRKDVIPGLLSKGEGYLNKKQLNVYDRQGNEVDADVITADNYKSYIFRQPPSERNALGQVKFDLPNPWAIYLHDTPSKGDFEKEDRDKSSGCIRLHKPRELADYILTEMNNDSEYDRDAINKIVNTNNTEYVKLKNELPVHILYLTAYVNDNGKLKFFKDIYNKDGEVLKSLR